MSRALEITVTPFLFGLGGYFLDGRLGTAPVLTLVLGILGLVGVFVKLWYAYEFEMRQHEQARPRRSGIGGSP